MDPTAAAWNDPAGGLNSRADELILPSRRVAVDRIRAALGGRLGPVLLTGDSGAGKTWLLATLREQLSGPWRWATVDLSPAVGALDFYRLVLHELGIDAGRSLTEARTALVCFLNDRSIDGECWVLCVEEGHSASHKALEELRILGNKLGQPGGFDGLILTGQNALCRRLNSQPLAPLASRLARRVHLPPLSVEELALWLAADGSNRSAGPALVEALHREVAGNARAVSLVVGRPVVPLVSPVAPAVSVLAERQPEVAEQPISSGVAAPQPLWTTPLVATVKPPIEIGDGMIEVGWDSAPDPGDGIEATDAAVREPDRTTVASTPSARPSSAAPRSAAAEERIDDHYAALQAWTEWARNQDREPASAARSAHPATETVEVGDPIVAERPALAPAAQPGVWAEGQHSFAPYSQLFTRLRESRDAS